MTLANLEQELILSRRLGYLFPAVGLMVSTAGNTVPGGDNPDLRRPIREGLLAAGVRTADPQLIADDDVARLSGEQFRHAMDVAEEKALRTACVSAMRGVKGMEGADAGKFRDDIRAMADECARCNAERYGEETPTPSSGGMDLGFSSRGFGRW